MKSAPRSCCSRTVATAAWAEPALNGVRTGPGMASSRGARAGMRSPAARCRSMRADPDICLNPVTPCASMRSKVAVGPGRAYADDPVTGDGHILVSVQGAVARADDGHVPDD